MNIAITRKCPACGGYIGRKSLQAKYCSEECKWRFNNKKRTFDKRLLKAEGKKV
jgi:predicted nucleic acid-binding Zn ribbon protein